MELKYKEHPIAHIKVELPHILLLKNTDPDSKLQYILRFVYFSETNTCLDDKNKPMNYSTDSEDVYSLGCILYEMLIGSEYPF